MRLDLVVDTDFALAPPPSLRAGFPPSRQAPPLLVGTPFRHSPWMPAIGSWQRPVAFGGAPDSPPLSSTSQRSPETDSLPELEAVEGIEEAD